MTQSLLMQGLHELHAFYKSLNNHNWPFAAFIEEAIRRLTIYDRPPTEEEVAEAEVCLYYECGEWIEAIGHDVRKRWDDTDRWMRLPEVVT